jgi:hypothetical protein
VFSAWAQTPDGAEAWLEIEFLDAEGEWLTGLSTGCTAIGLSPQPWNWDDHLRLSFTKEEVPAANYVILGLLQCLTNTEGRATVLFYDDVLFAVVSQ